MNDTLLTRIATRPSLPVFGRLAPVMLAVLGLGEVVLAQTAASQPATRYSATAVTPVGANKTGFTLFPPQQTGVWFTNVLAASRYLTNQILPNGSGVAAGDVDGDGWCDLYFCGLDSDNKLYRNLGAWRFVDITEQAGVGCPGLDATGAVLADLDGDGDLDLIVNSIGGGTHLFFNDGRARFREAATPLNPHSGGTSLALADIDGDGDLDLYVANYRQATLTDAPGTRFGFKMVNGQPRVTLINGRPLTDPEWTNRFVFHVALDAGGRGKFSHEELGEPDALYLNDGKGGFEPVPFTGGAFRDEQGQPLTEPPRDWGLSAMFRDCAGQGFPDLYVCNDFGTPDRFWLNDGHGHFRAAPTRALRHTSLASMALDVADLNRDGYDDFMVVDMLSRDHERRLTQRNIMRAELAQADRIDARPQYPRNTLFLNRGDGTYAEVAQYAGLEASEWSWNPIFLDVDLDGFEDLLVVNGFVRDNMNQDAMSRINAAKAGRRLTPLEELELRRFYPALTTANLAFQNLGNLRFAECGAAWGFAEAAISQGACLADLDNDGDMDVILNNLNQVASLYRNDSPAPRLAVRLRGRSPNTAGIGARITISGGPVRQSQEVVCGGRYLSSDQPMRVFAAGGLDQRLEIEVRWRGGGRSVVTNAEPNHLYEVIEPGPAEAPATKALAGTSPASSPVTPVTWFEDVSERLNHRHQETSFDDSARQPTLPRRLSQLGPGVAWWDLDNDGWDELVIGAGRGGSTAVFHNDGKGGFEPLGAWAGNATRSQAGLAGWGAGALLLALSSYEDGSTNGPAVVIGRMGVTELTAAVPATESSAGPLAAADYDGDGRLDLFVGGRVVPGRYPAPARSLLYRQTSDRLVLDQTNNARLAETGLVSGAVWTDLNGDGWPDLVLACDWGPLRVFMNERGQLQPWNPRVTWPAQAAPQSSWTNLSQLTGWWNGISSGDFDGDGELDIVAANWGLNSRYEHYGPGPVRLYYGDFDQDGILELIETGYEPDRRRFVPDRALDFYSRVMPFLLERFPTFQSWAATDIKAALGDRLPSARWCEAACRQSLVLLNRQDHLEALSLPLEAQLSPAFAVCVADADGDGKEDVFLSQNFFGVDMDTSRYDAGRGLWLRGLGGGHFAAVPGQVSGVKLEGEQRGAAVGDFDGDGRVDLLVAQNNAETRLYRNRSAQPGLRVRLRRRLDAGPVIGAVVRLQWGDRLGPAREVHAGSGYWSQDSPVLVLAQPEPATAVWVRWPGGQITLTPVPPNSREITVAWETPATR